MFELARIMGTSVKMIEAHYGTLIDTAHDAILSRLEGFGARTGLGHERGTRSRPKHPDAAWILKRMKGLEPSTFCMARTGRELTGGDWG